MPKVLPSLPPPPSHPKTHARLVGAWLLPRRATDHTRTATDASRNMRHAVLAHVAAGWTCAVYTPTGRNGIPLPRWRNDRPAPLPIPVLFLFPDRLPLKTRTALVAICAVWRPSAVLSFSKPPRPVYDYTPYVWRLRPTLPLSDAPDLLALTTPDPQALGDPRLHCWVVPPLTPTSPDLPAWRAVIHARPEVPVLCTRSHWRRWPEALLTRYLLLGAGRGAGPDLSPYLQPGTPESTEWIV